LKSCWRLMGRLIACFLDCDMEEKTGPSSLEDGILMCMLGKKAIMIMLKFVRFATSKR